MKVTIAVTLAALVLAAAPTWADDVPRKQNGRWAQDYTGRQADPAVLFGTLPNGVRYAIMHNTTPNDGVSMRMRIGSGSIQESADQQGLAHFLEHMAFRGSTNIPDGETVKMLERHGLRFGPDTNAYTAQDQTVYTLNFPKADQTALDTGLKLFREIGGRLTLAPAAVDAERGVILSEARLRDTPSYRSAKANFDNVLHGTRAVARWPIGTITSIQAATPAHLRAYYDANYRPDNATLIVVGNIDPKSVEQEIKARFSDWRPAGRVVPVINGTPDPEHMAAEYVADGAPDRLSLEWVKPADDRAETTAVERDELLRMVALTALNSRLSDVASKADAPVVSARAGAVQNLLGSASLTIIQITAAPDKWQGALDAVTEAQRRLLADGITPDELKRAVTVVRTRLQNDVDTAATRTNDALADDLVRTANRDSLFTNPAQNLALATPILSEVTPQDVDGALKTAFEGKGPVLFRSAQNSPATERALAAAVTQAYQRPLAARAVEATITWPYTDFGKVNAVVSQVTDEELGITLVTFAGGTRLLVKQTPYEMNKIHVSVHLGSGRAGTPTDMARALWAADLFTLGGTGKLSQGQIRQWTQSSGKVVSADLTAHNNAFVLSGLTRKADLLAEMELLAAYARDPGYRPELADKIAAVGPMIAGQAGANAGMMLFRGLQQVTSGGDDRYVAIPTLEQIAATKPGDLPALLREALSGPADVVMVGDVTLDEAIKATESTFAAGATRPGAEQVRPHVTVTPGHNAPWVFTHSGRADVAFYGEFWPTADYFADPQASYVGDVTAALLRGRLLDVLREKLGLTYSPLVRAEAAFDVAGLGYIGAAIETPATNFAAFKAIVDEQMADLAARPVSTDELDRARKPLVEAAGIDMQNNRRWARMLSLYIRDPRMKAPTLNRPDRLRSVTAADVTAFVERFVKGKTPYTIISKSR